MIPDQEDPKQIGQYNLVFLATAAGVEPGGIYRHYKGGLYVVTAVSLMEDTLIPLVTYRSTKGTAWTRTLANFTETVTPPMGGPRPRFLREEV